ncbi:MAG: hypothetical protein AMXMBFR82_27190 [Candidatus Hydrogenedentota bacterium]
MLKAVFFVFLLAPVGGGAVGALIAAISFVMSGEYASFGASFGIPIGAFTGLIHGLIFVWFLPEESLTRLIVYLTLGTLLGAMPMALIPDFAVPAWFGGVVGCWVAFGLFKSKLIEHYMGAE